MTVSRSYRSAVRRDHAAATRTAIAAAFTAQLGRPGDPDLSVPDAATRAGVAVRTVHHHFPDRTSRRAAVTAFAEDQAGPLPAVNGVDDLPDHARRVAARAGRHPELARATRAAAAADDARTRRLRARHLEIAALLTGIGAPPEDTVRATAVVALLASDEAIVPLVDVHGLTFEEAGEATAAAVAALVATLRARRSSGME